MGTVNNISDALHDNEAALEELSDFIDLCRRGFRLAATATELGDLIKSPQGVKKAQAGRVRNLIKTLKDTGERTRRYVDDGFATLYGVGIVRLWTALEATMNDCCMAMLQQDEFWKRAKATKNLKVRLVEFLGLSEQEQLSVMLDHVMTDSGARQAPGVGRFENLLNALDLGGDVPDSVKRQMVWLAEARHLLVHRHGIIDHKFTSRVPWIAATVGEKLGVSEDDFNRSRLAVRAYVWIVGLRAQTSGLIPAGSFSKEWLESRYLAKLEHYGDRRARSKEP